MAYFNEENTVEQMLINAAGKCGWTYICKLSLFVNFP